MRKKIFIFIISSMLSLASVAHPTGRIQFQGTITSNACDVFDDNKHDEKCQDISEQTGIEQLNETNHKNLSLQEASHIIKQNQQSEQVSDVKLKSVSTKENLGIIVVTYK